MHRAQRTSVKTPHSSTSAPRGPRSQNLPRPVVVGHLPPVSVHARHGGPGHHTRAFIYFAVEPIAYATS
jgi:hypothetical protein